MSDQDFKISNKTNTPSPAERGAGGEAFYIGWMAGAPKSIAGFIKKVLPLIFIAAVLLGILLAISQKKFSTATFEFGTLTEVKGVYFSKPVPSIKVMSHKDIFGNTSYITIPLVGYGKYGAEGVMKELAAEKGQQLDKKMITLKGTLLYGDGKTIMQVDKNDNPLIAISGEETSADLLPQSKELGEQKILGEIIDPKCYFGVMKPGEGKAHRDCAIRCILGGIPPVLHVQDSQGKSNYYFIVSSNGEPMNGAVQDFVAEPVAINARVVKQDDWIILYVNDNNSIQSISRRELIKPGLVAMSCSSSCMK